MVEPIKTTSNTNTNTNTNSEPMNGMKRIGDAASRAFENSGLKDNETVRSTQRNLQKADRMMRTQARERPYMMTALAVGAGVAVGMMLASGGGQRRYY